MPINEYGFRTLVIENACTLSYGDGNVIVRKDSEYEVPLSQLKSMIVNTNAVTVTSALLNELSKNNVNVIFCDSKHNPSFEISPFSNNVNSAGKISDQSLWATETKSTIWKNIVESKIINQRKLLESLRIKVPEKLFVYENSVLPGDKNNNEGMAARIYFKSLFGKGFKRHFPDETNAALNYGYILILSCFNRILTIHGYNTALGINHSNRKNRFNLSCDLMEPFRPFIDRIVYGNQERALDWEYKRLLIESLQETIIYGNKKMCFTDACEMYALDVLRSMDEGKCRIKELCLG